MTGPLVGTIVAKNYLPFARVLDQSLRRHHPEARLVVVLTDDGALASGGEAFSILTPADLGVPEIRPLAFRTTQFEFSVALKPYLLEKLLERADSALFLDADLLVLDELDSLFECVRSHDVTLVPHALVPASGANRIGRDLVLHRSGTFNGGVVGVRPSDAAVTLLRWWQRNVYSRCTHDTPHGMHYDQRWLDLIPGFVEDLHVHRDAGVNVGHWNLPERPIRIRDGRVTAGEVPCRLFHFSGFNPDDPETPTRYRPALRLEDIGEAARLYRSYAGQLRAACWNEARLATYAYDSFDNGVRIPEAARRLYASLRDKERFGDPFRAREAGNYFEWLRGGRPNRLWLFIHEQRPDLQRVFPNPQGGDRRRFLKWTQNHGSREHDVPPELV